MGDWITDFGNRLLVSITSTAIIGLVLALWARWADRKMKLPHLVICFLAAWCFTTLLWDQYWPSPSPQYVIREAVDKSGLMIQTEKLDGQKFAYTVVRGPLQILVRQPEGQNTIRLESRITMSDSDKALVNALGDAGKRGLYFRLKADVLKYGINLETFEPKTVLSHSFIPGPTFNQDEFMRQLEFFRHGVELYSLLMTEVTESLD